MEGNGGFPADGLCATGGCAGKIAPGGPGIRDPQDLKEMYNGEARTEEVRFGG